MILIPDQEFYRSADQKFFSWLRTRIFKNSLFHTDIFQEIDEIDGKIKVLLE